MPVVQGYIKGPMWIHFLVGVSAMYFSVPDTSNLLVHLFDNNNFLVNLLLYTQSFPAPAQGPTTLGKTQSGQTLPRT
jgi:hypothetical protein